MPNEVFRQARVVVIDDVQANLRLLESSLRTMGLGQVHGFSDSRSASSGCSKTPGICCCWIWTCRRRTVSRFCRR